MRKKLYEIWINKGSNEWKVFTDVTVELQNTLVHTGWSLAVQYEEDATDDRSKKIQSTSKKLTFLSTDLS